MSVDGSTLRRLAALNLPTEAFQEVLSIIADMQSTDDTRRAKQRERTLRSRHRNVTVTSPQRDNERYVPPQHINPPQVEKPKKVSHMRASPLPADWQLLEDDREYARSKGWAAAKIDGEAERFRDHALARGRMQRDWRAAWRNWVNSPFQKANAPPGTGGFAPRPGSKEDTRERTVNAIRQLDQFINAAADDVDRGRGAGEADARQLRLIEPPRS